MIRVSTRIAFLLTLGVLWFGGSARAAEAPVKGEIDLSSSFGDYRQGHFHGGIDIRTGGKTGREVIAPVSGYIQRLRTAYGGYGKAIYLRGDDGYIYVVAHLSKFSSRLDGYIKAAQVASKRYQQDIYLPKDSIRFKKGEFLAYSGQTGLGAPHLHFEKRMPNDRPINPLGDGIDLKDKIRPVFTRLGFKLTDDHSLFDNTRRQMFFNLPAGDGHATFKLDKVPVFSAPFGILVDGYDMMRAGGMKQGIYKLSLFIDDRLYYESAFDTVDYSTGNDVFFEYDYAEAANDRKRTRRLFALGDNKYPGSFARVGKSGTFGSTGKEIFGLHKARIVGIDRFRNKSKLEFEFLWVPEEGIYSLDTTIATDSGMTDFYFKPTIDVSKIAIDSVTVSMNKEDKWRQPTGIETTLLADNSVKCSVPTLGSKTAVLRLLLHSGHGTTIKEPSFSKFGGVAKFIKKIEHFVVDDGLIITVRGQSRHGTRARIELYHKDSLLGIEYPEYITQRFHAVFIPPKTKYAHIDAIGAMLDVDTSHHIRNRDKVSVNIHLVMPGKDTQLEIGKSATLSFDRDDLYQPQYIEVIRTSLRNTGRMGTISAHYQIFPEVFLGRNDFDLTISLIGKSPAHNQSGICWLDKKNDKWVWLDSEYDEQSRTLTTSTLGGGSFVALMDVVPPKISKLSVRDGSRLINRKPKISFMIIDSLSQVGNDADIEIKIDGQWMIPEYNPETKMCFTYPLKPLEPGKHHLGIRFADRAGNVAEQYLNFYVTETKKRTRPKTTGN